MKAVIMRYLILLIALYAGTAQAGELATREMYCDDTKTITKELRDKYNEIPVIIGKTDDVAESVMTFWTNPTENTWTILATNKDFSCIVGTGSKLTIIDYKRKKNI
jgi:hypothetical protein